MLFSVDSYYVKIKVIEVMIVTDSANKKLRRSRSDRIIAGVCGGLGEFFGLNPIWFRLGFLILLLPGGLPGLVPYILLWLIIPKG
jgi:phage shock protein C